MPYLNLDGEFGYWTGELPSSPWLNGLDFNQLISYDYFNLPGENRIKRRDVPRGKSFSLVLGGASYAARPNEPEA
jgi:hypothetical protein